MRIVVCLKRVPDTGARIRIRPDGTAIDPGGLKYAMNPYDEFAVEAALRTRDGRGEGEVIVLSLGEEATEETLRTALAMGADRAILLRGEPGPDGLATAKGLLGEVEGLAPDLVLLGVKAVDDDQQQVGPMLAVLSGRPCVTSVRSFRVEEGAVVSEREVEGGVETVRLPLPVVLTITKGEFEPRYPSLRGIMEAKKKPLEVKNAEFGPARILIEALQLPPERKGGRIVGEGADAVPELVRLLREEARVI